MSMLKILFKRPSLKLTTINIMMCVLFCQQKVYSQIPVTDVAAIGVLGSILTAQGGELTEEGMLVAGQAAEFASQQASLVEQTEQTALQTSELAAQGDLLTYLTTNVGIGEEDSIVTPKINPLTVIGHLTAIQNSIGNNALPYEARNAVGENLLNIMGGPVPQLMRRRPVDTVSADLLSELMFIDQSLTMPVLRENRVSSPLGLPNPMQDIIASGLINPKAEEILKFFLMAEAGCQLGVAVVDIAATIKSFFSTYDEYHATSLPENYLAKKTNDWSIETGAMVLGMYLSLGAQYGAFIKDYLQSNAVINASRQAQGVLQAIQINTEFQNLIIQQLQKERVIEMEHLALDLSNTLKDADYRAIKEAHSSQLMVQVNFINDNFNNTIRY